MKQITIQLKDIKPNPFKKEIDGGKLNEEQLGKLIEGYKQTTFHENLLARKNKKEEIELVYGHHRLEAAKRVYGKNHTISINLVDYNDEQMIIDMCRENLTQRWNEFRQELDAVLLSKKWLLNVQQMDDQKYQGRGGDHRSKEIGARQIATFLSKEGKTICKSKVADLLNMYEKLDKSILEKTRKFTNQQDLEEKGVTYRQALVLSRIEDKEEQKDLLEVIQKENGNVMEISKKINKYKEAPEEIKKKIREGEVDLRDIDNEVGIKNLQQKIEEGKKSEDEKIKIIRSKEIVDTIRDEILETHRQLDGLMYKVRSIRKGGFRWYDNNSKKDFSKLVSNILSKVDKWREELVKIKEEIGGD